MAEQEGKPCMVQEQEAGSAVCFGATMQVCNQTECAKLSELHLMCTGVHDDAC